MSNFTTFFPSAGGGGGEGSGINSFAPFLVGTTDNNPQGYIVSTGVYTNPVDASVWLKTGKFLDMNGDYPNAHESDYITDTARNKTIAQATRGFCWNGTNYLAIGTSDDTVYEYTSEFVATGNTFSIAGEGNDVPRGLTFDGTFYYTGDTDNTIRKWDSSFNFQSSFAATNVYLLGDLTVLNGNFYVMDQDGSKNIKIYNSAGTETGGWQNSTMTAYGMTNNGTNLVFSGSTSGGRLKEFTIAGVATGFEINTADRTGTGTNIVYNNGNYRFSGFGSTTFFLYSKFYGISGKTDSSGSGQPLFIKLK